MRQRARGGPAIHNHKVHRVDSAEFLHFSKLFVPHLLFPAALPLNTPLASCPCCTAKALEASLLPLSPFHRLQAMQHCTRALAGPLRLHVPSHCLAKRPVARSRTPSTILKPHLTSHSLTQRHPLCASQRPKLSIHPLQVQRRLLKGSAGFCDAFRLPALRGGSFLPVHPCWARWSRRKCRDRVNEQLGGVAHPPLRALRLHGAMLVLPRAKCRAAPARKTLPIPCSAKLAASRSLRKLCAFIGALDIRPLARRRPGQVGGAV